MEKETMKNELIDQVKNGLTFILDYMVCQESNEKEHHGDCTKEPQPCMKCMWLSFIDTVKLSLKLMWRYRTIEQARNIEQGAWEETKKYQDENIMLKKELSKLREKKG